MLAVFQHSGVGGIPGHAQGLGDARHCQMMDDHTCQRPGHRRPRELGARIGRLAHILAPHMGALLAPVAAHAHVQDRGALAVGFVRHEPNRRVARLALAPTAFTPPVITSDAVSQYCLTLPCVLNRRL